MKFLWLFISGLFFAPACAAQSQLPKELPEKLSISFNESGGMMRAWRKYRIENGALEYDQLVGGQRTPIKWTANVSREDLVAVYRVFLENKFDTIKNDERKAIVYDAGSENISITVGVGKSFHVTYGKNSPLSGENLKRYQKVSRALEDLVASYANRKTENASNDDRSFEEAEKTIRGAWRVDGYNGGNRWFLEWTFDETGNFKQTGYPPIVQEGKYKIVSAEKGRIKLELGEQKGTFGANDRTIEIIVEGGGESLTISGTRGFSRLPNKEPDDRNK